MNAVLRAVIALAALGAILTLLEGLLPRGGVKHAARAAIGLLFCAYLAEQIAGIFSG